MRNRLLKAASLAAAALMFLHAASAAANTAPTVKISPGYQDIGVNGTIQYSAAVTGLNNKNVTWWISGVKSGDSTNGTITAAGLYKAPAAIPKNGVTVKALASDNKTYDIIYVNVAPPGPTITAVTPNPLTTGTTTVTLTGKGFTDPAVINAGGVALTTKFVNSSTLTGSVYIGSAGSIAFKVRNSGSLYGREFTVTVNTKPGSGGTGEKPTISPASATVKLGGTQQFTSSGATGWSASAGSISSSGLYTAPATMPASSSVTITASGAKGSATAAVTLTTGVPQTVSPASASLALGATQQFTSSGATSWSASAGSITAQGLYTAPATLPASSTVSIIANGPNGTGNATVTLIPPTPAISAVGNGTLPLGAFTTTISGSGFVSQSVAKLNGSNLTTTFNSGTQLTVSGYAAQSGSGSVTVSTGSVTSQPYSVTVGVPNAKASAAAARRLLQQAAFGPTPSEAAHVQQVGLQGWLNEQYAMQKVSTYSGITSSTGGMPAHFLTMAVHNPDQLRQRTGFALSQIWVTSLDKLIWNDNMTKYQDMLMADAFGNYRQIMYDVTVSPAMGQFLDMANNAKANPATGAVANENYARELMQLFTIGTVKLNQDGSVQKDANGNPLPSYTQANVTELARVFTGWTYANANGQPAAWNGYMTSYPMVPYPSQHDTGAKTLLNGYVSPSGIGAVQDLNNALDNLFNHPNVGPFVARNLIIHLVKSNPSPAYISRVAAAFNNNGSGVRGDMKAVLTAIFMDSEARANDEGGADLAADGHLQEPALFIAGMVRAFGGQMTDENYWPYELVQLSQDLYSPPSVFNYFSPTAKAPGTALFGPEFQIHNPNNSIVRANLTSALMYSGYQKSVQTYGPGTTVDLTPFVSLASNPATLIDALDLALTRGVMPQQMKTTLVNTIAANNSGNIYRTQTAAYLILSSNYYNVWH